jgi:hypothetical protein
MNPLLAQATADPFSWVGPVLQLVQIGGFGALVWFFVYMRMPAMEKAALDERDKWMEYMQRRDEKFESLLERCVKTIEESNGHARRS